MPDPDSKKETNAKGQIIAPVNKKAGNAVREGSQKPTELGSGIPGEPKGGVVINLKPQITGESTDTRTNKKHERVGDQWEISRRADEVRKERNKRKKGGSKKEHHRRA